MENGQDSGNGSPNATVARSIPDADLERRRAVTLRDDARFKAEHEALSKVYHEAEKTYDSTLLYLTAGALVLSIGFVKDIGHPPVSSPSYLIWAWVAWSTSLVLLLLNQRLAARLHRRSVDVLVVHFRNYDPDKNPWPDIEAEQNALTVGWKLKNCNITFNGHMVVEWFNIAGLVLFVIGIILIGVFICRNLH